MSKAEFNAIPLVSLPSGKNLMGDQDTKVDLRNGETSIPTQDALANTASPAALKVGDVVPEGPDKGWIYCETEGGNRFLVAPEDSGVMLWHEAIDHARHTKSELPVSWELAAIYEARNTGALKGTFSEAASDDASWYWSSRLLNFSVADRAGRI